MDEGTMRLDRSNTAIVVDSTADLPPDLAAEPGVSMVPLNVHFGEQTFRDWVDMDAADFYRRLRTADPLPTTSAPAPGLFEAEYRRLRHTYERVYSIHISAELSATHQSALVAQRQVDGVRTIDTQTISLAISLLVRRLLALLDRGTDDAEITAYAERYRREAGVLFMLDTLEYLQRGGRIGRASSLAGSLLNIKPLLTITDGVVDAHKRVRGEQKALQAMLGYVLDRTSPGAPVYTAVAHADAPERATSLSEHLLQLDRDMRIVVSGQVGSVIGTYAGPGAVAVFFMQE